MSKLLPRKPVPELKVRTVNGEEWDVYEKTPEHFIIKEVLRSIIGINKSNYPARGEA